jgi:hypothetical protein
MPRPLTPNEQRFVDEYLIDLNATRAYRTAYPAATYQSARVLAARLLAKVRIRDEIKAARAAQQNRTRVRADAVLRALAAAAFSDVGDLFDADGNPLPARRVPLHARRALQAVRVRPERTTTRTTVARRGGATVTTEVTVTTQLIEFRFADKVAALDKLCRYLGLDESIPPLDRLLEALPADLAAAVRARLDLAGGENAPPNAEHPAGDE